MRVVEKPWQVVEDVHFEIGFGLFGLAAQQSGNRIITLSLDLITIHVHAPTVKRGQAFSRNAAKPPENAVV